MPETMNPREKVKLKPCPFCGGTATRYTAIASHPNRQVSCRTCGASAFDIKWNRRTALASSGDHAELARVAAYVTHAREINQGAILVSTGDLEALIAEVAALRDKTKALGLAVLSWNETAIEQLEHRDVAERKLAEAEDYAKSVAKEALAYRNALLRVKERMRTWPIDDYENCMCGSTINSHDMGSGHSPVAVADHAVSLIVKDIEEVINAPMGV